MTGISIIICCYNSAVRIVQTLEHIFDLTLASDISCEVIIVNNNSTDNTAAVVTELFERNRSSAVKTWIVDEPVAGLSSARKRGVAQAKFPVLLFCDDDNHLERDYILRASELLKDRPDAGILGAWAKPRLPAYPGKWIEDCYPALAIGKQSEHDGYVDWVFGAGMILRKEVFDTLTSRNIALLLSDRVGTKQTSGGDAEICLAARFVGYKIFYSNSLVLHHAIAVHRLTKKSFIKANYRNVFPLVYLYLMENLMKNGKERVVPLYRKFFAERIKMIFYFIPRWFFGKHRFYSFMMLYQNVQLTVWLLKRRSYFAETTASIKRNLYHAGE